MEVILQINGLTYLLYSKISVSVTKSLLADLKLTSAEVCKIKNYFIGEN